jgi:hypothetical protein
MPSLFFLLTITHGETLGSPASAVSNHRLGHLTGNYSIDHLCLIFLDVWINRSIGINYDRFALRHSDSDAGSESAGRSTSSHHRE